MVANKTICQDVQCDLSASFGYAGGKRIYCSKHKILEMVNIAKHGKKFKSDLCKQANCTKSCNFGLIGGLSEYCFAHKKDGMVNVNKKKLCLEEGCNLQPSFALPGDSPVYCSCHKLDGMVNINAIVCNAPGCVVHCSFGFLGQKVEKCVRHKEEGMVSLVKSLQCEYPDCTKSPTFGNVDKLPLRCLEHKTEDMNDVINARCISCGLSQARKINGFLCATCNPESSTRSRTKEFHIKTLLETAFPTELIRYNQSSDVIQDCTGKRYRPDFVIEKLDRVIIIENDEYYHRDNEISCEVTRMINLTMAYNGIPVVFIRYNCDHQERLIPLKKSQREAVLVQTVSSYINSSIAELMTVKFLYYPSSRQELLEEKIATAVQSYMSM